MREALIAMMIYLGIFGLLLIVSLISLVRGVAIFNIGIPATAVNSLVLALSAIGLLKSMWHIHRIQL